jgi:hypothetical protein
MAAGLHGRQLAFKYSLLFVLLSFWSHRKLCISILVAGVLGVMDHFSFPGMATAGGQIPGADSMLCCCCCQCLPAVLGIWLTSFRECILQPLFASA